MIDTSLTTKCLNGVIGTIKLEGNSYNIMEQRTNEQMENRLIEEAYILATYLKDMASGTIKSK